MENDESARGVHLFRLASRLGKCALEQWYSALHHGPLCNVRPPSASANYQTNCPGKRLSPAEHLKECQAIISRTALVSTHTRSPFNSFTLPGKVMGAHLCPSVLHTESDLVPSWYLLGRKHFFSSEDHKIPVLMEHTSEGIPILECYYVLILGSILFISRTGRLISDF